MNTLLTCPFKVRILFKYHDLMALAMALDSGTQASDPQTNDNDYNPVRTVRLCTVDSHGRYKC
jgi:hypothetical protein